MKPKCFICQQKATSYINSQQVCRGHFDLLKKLRKDKALWEIIKKCLGVKK